MKTSLWAKFNALPVHQKYRSLSVRERVLATLAAFVVIGFGGAVLLLETLIADIQRVERQILSASASLAQTEQKIHLFEKELEIDPNDKLRMQLTQVENKIAQVDKQFSTQVQDLVPPQQMPELLETVLQKASGLNIIEMSSIAPIDILKEIHGGDSSQTQESLFQHGVRLTAQGRYFDVQAYLAELEDIEWRFYWKSFHYTVDEYPLATVELEIYTLSTNKAFIGV